MGRFRHAGLCALVVGVVVALVPAGASASAPGWVYCGKARPKHTGAYTDKACSVESATHEGG
jgi:hypothetical protein